MQKYLFFREGQWLDMAIKYSSHEWRRHLQEVQIMIMSSPAFPSWSSRIYVVTWMYLCLQAIAAWEEVARLIQKRELLLCKLEDFEREAPDPSRFFQRGRSDAQNNEFWPLKYACTDLEIIFWINNIYFFIHLFIYLWKWAFCFSVYNTHTRHSKILKTKNNYVK